MKIKSILRSIVVRLNIIAIPVIYVFCVGNSFAGLAWSQEAFDIGKSSINVLVNRSICVDENDCVKKEYIFAAGGGSGINVFIYGVSDVQAIKDIVDICLTKYSESNKKISVTVSAYHSTHRESMGVSKQLFEIPYMKIILQGDK